MTPTNDLYGKGEPKPLAVLKESYNRLMDKRPMKPTLGRIVHYTFPAGEQSESQSRTVPAIIVAVWSDTCVNLRVFQDSAANPIWQSSVCERDAGNEAHGNYWEWPKC